MAIQDLSDAEIDAEISRLGVVRSEARAQQVMLTAEHDRRAADRSTDALLAKLSPAERASFLAKLQMVQPESIAVSSAAREPG